MCKGWGGGGGTKQSVFYPKCDSHHPHGQSRNLFSHIQTVMRFVQPLCSLSLGLSGDCLGTKEIIKEIDRGQIN